MSQRLMEEFCRYTQVGHIDRLFPRVGSLFGLVFEMRLEQYEASLLKLFLFL